MTSSILAARNLSKVVSSTEGELLSCYDEGPAWVGVEIDTSVFDPVLQATIFDEFGNPIDQFGVMASELEVD